MNKELLKYYILQYDKTQKNLAEAMGISASALNAKINNYRGAEFTEPELRFIMERYRLDVDEFNRIFFSDIVS
ncbi:MAG: XRE family transcriptional regulator [Clostridiales bacterium]|nr:XRE family transcriptional regulator [Clostridiales bacterium]MBR3261337.1 XRE family transcriptional regulator [Bacillota bacterium]MBR3375635.1 XRE family transcriptional regulator [Bacillota bacterium]